MDIIRERDKKYTINPYLEVVGHSMFEGKILARTNGSYQGIYKGKEAKIIKEDRVKVIQDRSKYLKFYLDTAALSEFVELSLSAQKILLYLIVNRLEFEKDYVNVTISTIPVGPGMSRTTINSGFYELLDRNWLARSEEPYKFWINVGFFSYGSREEIFRKHYDLSKVTLKGDK